MSALNRDRPWAFLTPDLLLDVSGRLHDAADFIRFHAVCTSWRDLPHSPATRPKFLPWLLTQYKGRTISSPVIYSRRVDFPSEGTSSYHGSTLDDVVPVATAQSDGGGDINWVASADGATAWFFTGSPEPRLVDLVTGSYKPLPYFPNHDDNDYEQRMRNPHGIVYDDGTVFLYTFTDVRHYGYHCYTAAILRPGDAAWTVMQKRQNVWPGNNACAAYHDGKVMVWPNMYSWYVLTPDFQANSNQDSHTSKLKNSWGRINEDRYVRYRRYVLESHGELLQATVLVKRDWYYAHNYGDPSPELSVIVHALEQGPGNVMQWVVRDGSRFADHVLYLGFQASFSADAAQLGIRGGSAYFVFMHHVFKCSLVVDGEAELMMQGAQEQISIYMTAALTSLITRSRWADLRSDLIGDVAGRLHNAVDFVRFHAICTPWHDSLVSLTTTRPRRVTFPSWPLLPCKGVVLHSVVDLSRDVSSKRARRSGCNDIILAEPPGVSFAGDNDMTWVGSVNGTGVWLFTNTRLLNVLTGAVTRLPRFPEHDDRRYKRRMENSVEFFTRTAPSFPSAAAGTFSLRPSYGLAVQRGRS